MNIGEKFQYVISSCYSLPIDGPSGIFAIIDSIIGQEDIKHESNLDYYGWLKDMEELGHINIDNRNRKIYVEPPQLIISTFSKNQAYLIGARTQEFVEAIVEYSKKNHIKIVLENFNPLIPLRLKFVGEKEKLINLAHTFKLLLNNLPQAYINALESEFIKDITQYWKFNNIDLSHYEGHDETYKVRFFNPSTLKFDGKQPENANEYTLGLIKHYGNHFNMYRVNSSCETQVCTDVKIEYGKWYCLSKAGYAITYNKIQKSMLIPKYCRLPSNIARALTYCKCKSPIVKKMDPKYNWLGFKERNSMEFLSYNGIPEIVAELIAKKVDVNIRFN